MEDLKKALFEIRNALEMMEFQIEPKQDAPYKVKLWMPELKQAVNQLDEISKTFHKQYDIIELHNMTRDEIDYIADNYDINRLSVPKQTIIYEILDKQAK